MTEDSEFFQRALKNGARYYVIPTYIAVSDRRFNKRSPASTVKVAVLGTLVMTGMFLGIKSLQKYSGKYEKAKGPLGGKTEKDQ